ncbi:MAG: hypothetical protein KAR33_14485 [Candidatus Thorarchaeota archaeon]|nr:hypothetical protein [Candidatus Thorarchaeota archaeon]
MTPLTILDNNVRSAWSLSGHTSGHFRPLAAYTVTSLSKVEANNMKYVSSNANNGNNSNDSNNSGIIDPMIRIYNYHWSVTE